MIVDAVFVSCVITELKVSGIVVDVSFITAFTAVVEPAYLPLTELRAFSLGT